MGTAQQETVHLTEAPQNGPSTHSFSSESEVLSGNLGECLFPGEWFERTPTATSSPESRTDPDLNRQDVNLGRISDRGNSFVLVNPQKRHVEDYLHLFATRSTLKATDGPMSILRKIVNLQTQLPHFPSDPLKTFLNSQWSVEYVLAHSDKVTDHWYFKPMNYKNRHSREDIALRLRTSKFARCIALVGMGVVEAFHTGDMSQSPLHNLWLGHIEGAVKRELTRELAPREIQQYHSDLVHISLLKTIVIRSSNLYQVLQSITPTFLQVVYSDPKLWPSGSDLASIPLSNILISDAYELAVFVLMDCTCAMAFGLPQHVEYDTTIYLQPSSSPSVQCAYGSPVEFQAVFADINACRDKSSNAREWRQIEQWLLAWQSRPSEHAFTESWMTVAWYAVQESWRLALLAYLYMASFLSSTELSVSV